MEQLRNPRVSGVFWLLARLWLGATWLMSGVEKVFGAQRDAWIGANAGASVTRFLNGAIEKSPLAPGYQPGPQPPAVSAWYAELVQNVFLPNAQIFSYLVAFGELLVGIALIIGIVTRFSALMGVVMNLAYLFAGAVSNNPQMLVVGLAIVLAGGVAAGYYGVDHLIRSRLQPKPDYVAASRGDRQRSTRTPQLR